MDQRLTSRLIVSALLRGVESAGGNGVVIARGDDGAGGILLLCAEKGEVSALLELAYTHNGDMMWRSVVAQPIDNKQKISDYVENRRRRDPDLWVFELDVPDAERFAADFVSNA